MTKLDDWILVAHPKGGYRLCGFVNDKVFIKTSQLKLIEFKKGYAETQNSIYVLQAPAQSYVTVDEVLKDEITGCPV